MAHCELLNAGAKCTLDAMSKYGDCCVGLFLLPAWYLGLFLLESCPSTAQIAVSSATIADCQDVALEATPHIYRASGDVQVIAIDYRNTTARPCILHPYTALVANLSSNTMQRSRPAIPRRSLEKAVSVGYRRLLSARPLSLTHPVTTQ